MAAKKATIPAHIREEVWRRYGGTHCWCCQAEPISSRNKHFGHVLAEAEGGLPTVENLRPVCANCNLRMRTQNMYDFMVAEGYPLRDVAAIHRILAKDPGLAEALRGRDLYAVPTITARGTPAPDYDYVLAESLVKRYPFLAPVDLEKLFDKSSHEGIVFHFIVRPEYVRWARHKQEAAQLEEVEKTLARKG